MQIMTALAEGDRAWAIPWPCCYEFLSVSTNRRIWKDEVSTPTQASAVRGLGLLAHQPHDRRADDFLPILQRFVDRPRIVGGVVHDARIAAICVAHGVDALLTRDRDFARFPELTVRDPFLTGR